MANEDSLSDAVEELDKLFVDGIRRLKTAVSDNRTVALGKTKHAEQVIDGLKANIIGLEARVRETEDTLHNQNVAGQKMEDSLKTQIGDLERALKEKEEALQSRISRSKRSHVQNRCHGRPGNAPGVGYPSRQDETRRARSKKPSTLLRISRQTSLV